MRKPVSHFFVLLIVAQSIVALAQAQSPAQGTPVTRPVPGFTLTLSEGHRGSIVASYQVLVVTLTNTSKEVMRRTACESFGGMINLEVVYNGVPVEKTDAEREWRKQHETGPCTGSIIKQETKPGETRQEILYYNTTKPGTYEITATKETFPGKPEKSVTVRSNTITIIVPEPEPEADAPK